MGDHGERIDGDPYLDIVAPARSERERRLHVCEVYGLRPCPLCSGPMLASRSGNGYCVPCAHPLDDVPLVPVSWPPKRFFQIKSAYERAIREHIEDVRKWRRYMAPGSRPGSLRVVTEKREDPTEVDEYLFRFAKVSRQRRASRAGGRPRKFTAKDLKDLRWLVETYPFITTKKLAERFKVDPRTIRHYLKRLGLKLKKSPARQPKQRLARPARRS